MFETRLNKWHWMLIGLFAANIAYYIYNNWGLVTVKVTEVPLKKVISSIEWQGWVTIYTNLPLDTKVTMYADHVPVSEAMETLAANVDVPAPPDDGSNPNPDRPRHADRPDGFVGATPANGGGGSGTPGAAPGAGGPGDPGAQGGRPGGRGGGFGGGGFGRRAEWNLAFFVAPTSSQLKQEIREFQTSDPDTDAKVYTYGTQMQLIATESMSIMADPRQQSWPGVKPPDPAADPPGAGAQANAATPAQASTDPANPTPPPPTAIETYLQAFTQSANIWIMAPGSWNPAIPSAPPANSSIIRAVKNFVSGIHGTMTQAIVLRAGRGGPNGNPPGGDVSWEDRMRNAINGLPADERPDAIDQLNQEVQFRKSVQALPQDQRRKMMFQHMAEKMIYGERLARLSPTKRAQVYHRMIMMRQAAKGAK
jgi:hypothetical protein